MIEDSLGESVMSDEIGDEVELRASVDGGGSGLNSTAFWAMLVTTLLSVTGCRLRLIMNRVPAALQDEVVSHCVQDSASSDRLRVFGARLGCGIVAKTSRKGWLQGSGGRRTWKRKKIILHYCWVGNA